MTSDMKEFMVTIKKSTNIAIVSGSDYPKICEQIGDAAGKLSSISEALGEDYVQELINFILLCFSQIKLSIKRGNFIEFRKGMINVSPIGRSCTVDERDAFFRYDKEHKIRESIVNKLKAKFGSEKLQFSIGGQISIDIFPKGWDKRYCLEHIKDIYSEVHFFGDKTYEGGNDYEIANDPRVISHTVTDPDDTMRQLKTLFPRWEEAVTC